MIGENDIEKELDEQGSDDHGRDRHLLEDAKKILKESFEEVNQPTDKMSGLRTKEGSVNPAEKNEDQKQILRELSVESHENTEGLINDLGELARDINRLSFKEENSEDYIKIIDRNIDNIIKKTQKLENLKVMLKKMKTKKY